MIPFVFDRFLPSLTLSLWLSPNFHRFDGGVGVFADRAVLAGPRAVGSMADPPSSTPQTNGDAGAIRGREISFGSRP